MARKTPTLPSDNKIVRLATDALLLCAALLLSYLEAVIPMPRLPLPGFKPGLANLAITVAAFRLSPIDAGVVSLARVLITFLLFGSPTSLLFSFFGSVLVFLWLSLASRLPLRMSYIGIALISATLHNAGQFLAALALVGTAVLSYVPFLLLASLFFGALSGIILNLLPDSIWFYPNPPTT